MRVYFNVTEEDLKKAKEWKELGEKYNLSPSDIQELAYHVKRIKEILDKKIK